LYNMAAASYTSGFDSPTATLSIGWRNIIGDESFFAGSIDEVSIYNTALDDASIAQHYDNGLLNKGYCPVEEELPLCSQSLVSHWKLDEISGSIYDDYIGTNNATSTNIPTPIAGIVLGAQQFNGTSNRIIVPSNAIYNFTANSSFTFETWIKHPAGSSAGSQTIIGRKATNSSLSIRLGFESTTIVFVVRSKTGELHEVTGPSLDDDDWHHVVGVKDGSLSQLRIYVDGILRNTEAASYTSGFDSPTTALSIGWRNIIGDEAFFEGSIDEVSIYNTALDEASITQNYNNGLQNTGNCVK
jgi:hypothetical protein